MDYKELFYNNSDTFQNYEKFIIINYSNKHTDYTVRKLYNLLKKTLKKTKQGGELLNNFDRLLILQNYMKKLIIIYTYLLDSHIGIVPYKLLLETDWNPVIPIKFEVCNKNQILVAVCNKCKILNSYIIKYHKKNMGKCKFCKADRDENYDVDTLKILKLTKKEVKEVRLEKISKNRVDLTQLIKNLSHHRNKIIVIFVLFFFLLNFR